MQYFTRYTLASLLIPWAAVTLLTALTALTDADEVRYYNQDGQSFCETRQVVREPVRELRYETKQQTYYRPRPESVRNVTQTQYIPVTKYRWETRWHNQMSLLQSPHMAYHAVPYTAWEPRTTTHQIVEPSNGWTTETRNVRVQVPTLRFVEKQNVSRVAVGPSDSRFAGTSTSTNQMARANEALMLGGIARLDGDPPRQGARVTTDDGWRARR